MSAATGTSRRLQFLLALLVAAYVGVYAFYPGLFLTMGVNHYGVWFLDTFAILASNDAVARGLDPYAPNPLDYFNRPHVYSHWWLHLRDFGLTRADTRWVGCALVAGFLLTALWWLRPRGPRQFFWYAAVLCSSPVLLALERGNNDLVIFVLLAPLVPCLLDERRMVRLCAPFLVAVAAMLKYYPAAAGLVLLSATDPKELRVRLIITLLLLAFVGVSMAGDLAAFGPLAPKPEGLLTFGSMAFFNAIGWRGWAPQLVCATAGAAAVIFFWHRRMLDGWIVPAGQRNNYLSFILGAVLLTGCFFTSLNFSYRLVFAVWLAPLLWELPHTPDAPSSVRRLARITGGLFLGVLWVDALWCLILNRLIGLVRGPVIMHWADRLFLVEQPLVWALFVCLLAFLVHFTRGGVNTLLRRSR